MSITLRLEGLSSAANSRDIREYFFGLEIPLGGVTVIGGKRGEAFVNFITWEDARRAIQQSGRPLKDSTIYVSLSSNEEMQQTLEKAETISKASISDNNGTHEEKHLDERGASSRRTHLYLLVKVSASEATIADVKRYFYRLNVRDVLFCKDLRSVRNGEAIVQFANSADAVEGIQRYRDSKSISVIWSSEKEWVNCGGTVDYDDEHSSSASTHGRKRTRSRSPRRRSRSPRRHSRSPRRRSRSPRRRSRSPRRRSRSLRRRSRSRRRYSRSPFRRSRSPRRHTRSPQIQSDELESIYAYEFHVHVSNLSYTVEKADLKTLFYNVMSDDDITFLRDEKGYRTRECFVTFSSNEHRRKVLQLHKYMLKGRPLYISSISKSNMRKLLFVRKAICWYDYTRGKCVYLRNFPSDVSKKNIQEFFTDFSLSEEDIFLLCDKRGIFRGEVLVRLSTEEEVTKAEKLNRTEFKGKEIPLKLIPEEKLKSFLRASCIMALPSDPYECVTQEDDLSEDKGVTQKDGTSEEKCVAQGGHTPDASTHDNDGCFVMPPHMYECVTQADDEINDDCVTHAVITQEDKCLIEAIDEPNDDCITQADITHEETCLIQAIDEPNDECGSKENNTHGNESVAKGDDQ
ncbi:RNA-binding protein 12B-B-like [Mixophyes fleayi]|uniref:RNA-binding protein 12B-B-like n=1 Tax=Mixophyes fleayi TaxID=3061075 RepID=UPI003F4DD115